MRFMIPAAAAAAAFAFAGPASAMIISGDVFGGSIYGLGGVFQQISAPAVSGNHNQVSNNLLGWEEQQHVTLGSALATDLGAASVAAGTLINADVITFDPAVTSATIRATVTFNGPILAVIYTRDNLIASDWLNVGTTYNSPTGRGLELFDFTHTVIDGNPLRFTWSTARPGDQIRVITGVVPEAATWAMMIAGFGLVGVAARRRRAATAVRS